MTESGNEPSPTNSTVEPLRWWAQILAGDPAGRLEPGQSKTGGETYAALPRPTRATILVDRRSTAALADAVGRAGQGRARAAAGRVLRIRGFARIIPGKVSLHAPSSTLADQLAGTLAADVRLSASCGPLRPNRKPVVRSLDGDDQLLAVTKVGWDPVTDDLINNEGDTLVRVGAQNLPGLVVPEVVDATRWRGLTLLTVTPLPIDATVAPHHRVDSTIDALQQLASVDRTTVDSVRESAFWQRLVDRLGAEPESDRWPSLDIGGFHGDWSPWNTQRRGSDLLVWDWERFATDVPVGIDVVHYAFQVERFMHGKTPIEARQPVVTEVRGLLPELGVNPDLADHLVDLYLLEALARNSGTALSGQLTAQREALREALSPRWTNLEALRGPHVLVDGQDPDGQKQRKVA